MRRPVAAGGGAGQATFPAPRTTTAGTSPDECFEPSRSSSVACPAGCGVCSLSNPDSYTATARSSGGAVGSVIRHPSTRANVSRRHRMRIGVHLLQHPAFGLGIGRIAHVRSSAGPFPRLDARHLAACRWSPLRSPTCHGLSVEYQDGFRHARRSGRVPPSDKPSRWAIVPCPSHGARQSETAVAAARNRG